MLVQTPEKFKERFNIDVRIKQEVIKIDKEKKKLQIKNKATGEIYIENYDKLVLSPGAEPINPFKGVKSDRIFTIRNVKDAEKVKMEKARAIKDLDEELNADKNLVYVYEIFKSIIEKINPVDEINF